MSVSTRGWKIERLWYIPSPTSRAGPAVPNHQHRQQLCALPRVKYAALTPRGPDLGPSESLPALRALVSHTVRYTICPSSKITPLGTDSSKDPDAFWEETKPHCPEKPPNHSQLVPSVIPKKQSPDQGSRSAKAAQLHTAAGTSHRLLGLF